MFLMIDGIDGCGKSTIHSAWAGYLAGQGKSVFNIKSYCKTHGKLPTLEEVMVADVIVTAEPSIVGIGAVIREELIRTQAPYAGRSVAEAFSLDRLVLYTRLIIPLLEAKKLIIQDRGVSTSLCFQPIQDSTLTRETVSALEGNALALKYRPDVLIIADVPVEAAVARMGARIAKQDDAKFEQASFMQQARDIYLSSDFQSLFTSRGSLVDVLNTDEPLAIMNEKAIALLSSYL